MLLQASTWRRIQKRQAANQGHPYAELLPERQNERARSSGLLSVTRLLYHMGRIFQENVPAQNATTMVQHIDSKPRRKMQEKRIAMGHKPDDHPDYQGPTMSM